MSQSFSPVSTLSYPVGQRICPVAILPLVLLCQKTQNFVPTRVLTAPNTKPQPSKRGSGGNDSFDTNGKGKLVCLQHLSSLLPPWYFVFCAL